MALQVTSAALGDITAGVGTDLKFSNQATRRTAVLDFTYKHATNVLTPEDEIQVYDGATRVFRGRIRNRKRQDTGPGPNRRRVFGITCQDTTTYLADDVIDATLVLAAGQSDQAMIQAVVAYSRTCTAAAPYNQVVVASMPAAIDVSGLTVYDAIQAITQVSGAQFYVDDSLRVHNFTTESNTAPFALVDYNANGTTRIGCRDLVFPDETFELVNAVWVTGGEGTTPEWRPPTGSWPTASHTTYGRRERALTFPDCKDQGELQRLGDAYLADHGVPRSPVTCTVYQPGLKAGMTATVDSQLWGVNQALPIVQVDTTIVPGTKGTLQYDVTLGDLADDLGTIIRQVQVEAQAAIAQVIDAVGPDTTVPPTVTGLGLTPYLGVGEAGQGIPYLVASWASTGMPPDLSAYELEVAQAIQAAPQFTATATTGGTLASGVYTVLVTGVGLVGGETYGQAQQVQVTGPTGRIQVNITALGGMASYRVYASLDQSPKWLLDTAVTGSAVNVDTAGAGATPPLASTAVDFASPYTVRTPNLKATISPVIGGLWHQARVKAVDTSGNRSASWSALASAQALADTTAPSIPSGLAAVPGYRLVGLTWQRNNEPDLGYYQVRWFQADTPPADPLDWTILDTRSTTLVLTGLDADVPYVFQVQAVDQSGNGSGWSDDQAPYVTATPTLVGAADLAVNSIVTTLLNAGTISADYISGGSLKVGGIAGLPAGITVYDSQGRLIGTWDVSGLRVYDPANNARRIVMTGGALKLVTDGNDGNAQAAITPDGIDATAIRLGSLSGGPNAIPNAGMEMTAFATTFSTGFDSSNTGGWTAYVAWTADVPTAGTYRVNVDRSTGDLKLTAY